MHRRVSFYMHNDEFYMKLAIAEAEKALEIKEVPVGAVVICDGRVVGRGYNLREKETGSDCSCRLIAIRDAARNLKSWRLDNCDLYVTLEPCPMCAGAIVQARIRRLVFGAYDPKSGATGSLYNIVEDERLNHQLSELKGGVLAEEMSQMLKSFFKKLRDSKPIGKGG